MAACWDAATHKIRPGALRLPEFDIPNRWLVTEKIDGTNVRIILSQRHETMDVDEVPVPRLRFAGRTDAAQMPPSLLAMLQERFPVEKIVAAFDPGTTAIIFGEGYGPKIQKGGGNYSPAVSFRVFDVVVFGASGRPWWLNWGAVEDIAEKIGARTVPVLSLSASLDTAMVYAVGDSIVAAEENSTSVPREGIVARTHPLLFMRTGERLVWKLKAADVRNP